MDPLSAWILVIVLIAIGMALHRMPKCPNCGSLHYTEPHGRIKRVRLCSRCGEWWEPLD